MKFLFDNNLGIKLAKGMQGFGENAVHVTEVFLQNVPDSQLFQYASQHSMFIISRDLRMRRNPAEHDAIRKYRVGIFFLGGKNRDTCQLIEQTVRNWRQMKERAAEERRPFAFLIPPKGTKFESYSL
jgi:predicted nuclease of predicted toxin-antitoxin system